MSLVRQLDPRLKVVDEKREGAGESRGVDFYNWLGNLFKIQPGFLGTEWNSSYISTLALLWQYEACDILSDRQGTKIPY